MPRTLRNFRRLLAALLAIVVPASLIVTVPHDPRGALHRLAASVWLANGADHSVTGIELDAATAGARMKGPSDRFTVVQRADGAYVIDETTGRVTKIDAATLQMGTARELGDAGDIDIVTGTTTYVIRKSSGVVQAVDPFDLRAQGGAVALNGAITGGLVDDSGTAWFEVPSRGAIVQVVDGVVSEHAVGAPGARLRAVPSSFGPIAVDLSAGVVQQLRDSSRRVSIGPEAQGDALLLAAGSSHSATTAVVKADRTLLIDTATYEVATVATAPARPSQVVAGSGYVYVLDSYSGVVQVIDSAARRVTTEVSLAGGHADQLVVVDDRVYVNDTSGSSAMAIDGDGRNTALGKYDVPVVTQRPAEPSTSPSASQTVTVATSGTPGRPTSTTPGTTGPLPTSSGGVVPAVLGDTTTARPIPPPGSPTRVTADTDDGALVVRWQPPASVEGVITAYRVTDARGHDAQVGGSVTATVLGGLINNERTCVRVQSLNQGGWGAWSDEACATPSVDAPTAPASPRAVHGSGSVTVSWEAAAPNRTSVSMYSITVEPGGRRIDVSSSTTSTVVSGLTNGTNYRFAITATSAAGKTGPAATAAATPSTTPSVVINMHVYGMAGGAVGYDFGPAADNGGAPVTKYRVYVNGAVFTESGNFHAGVVTGLPPGQPCVISITAFNLNGEGRLMSSTAVPTA